MVHRRNGTENFSLDNKCWKTNCYSHPVTAIAVENVVNAKLLNKEDPRITHEETQDSPDISSESVNKFVHEKFGV